MRAGPTPRLRSPSMGATPPLNPDFERRAVWQASMTAVAGSIGSRAARRSRCRRGRRRVCRDHRRARAGPPRRRRHAARGAHAWLGRFDPQWRHRPRRLQVERRVELIKRYGEETGKALYQETLDSYQLVKRLIAEESIDCDFREVGHLELAYAPAHAPELEHARESLALGRRSLHGRAAGADPRRDRHRRLLRRPRRSRAAGCCTQAAISRVWRHRPIAPAPTCTKACGPDRSGASRRWRVRGRDGARHDPCP